MYVFVTSASSILQFQMRSFPEAEKRAVPCSPISISLYKQPWNEKSNLFLLLCARLQNLLNHASSLHIVIWAVGGTTFRTLPLLPLHFLSPGGSRWRERPDREMCTLFVTSPILQFLMRTLPSAEQRTVPYSPISISSSLCKQP